MRRNTNMQTGGVRRLTAAILSRRPDRALAGVLFLGTLVVYLQTMRRTIGWGDASELATAAYFLGIGHSPGYPTYMLIGYPFAHLPFATVAFRMNLMSALFGSVAVALSYFVFRRVTERRLPAFVGAAAFAFTASFWDVGTDADVHTLHLTFVAAIVLLLLRWRETGRPQLAWPALLCGLSLGNHALTLLLVPGVLFFIAATKGGRVLVSKPVGIACLAFLLGASVYVYLPIRGPSHPPPGVSDPQNLHQVFLQMTAPGSRESMFSSPPRVVLAQLLKYASQRLPLDVTWPGVAIGLVGLPLLWRRDKRLAITLLLLAGCDVLYSVNYSIFDIYAYFIASYWVWCAFIAVGAEALFSLLTRGLAAIQGTEKSLGPRARQVLVGSLLLVLPFWLITGHWRMVDVSQDRSAEQFARAAMSIVAKDALVLSDWWAIAPLGYLKYVDGVRRDVTLSPAFSLSSAKAKKRYLSADILNRYPAVYTAEIQTGGTHELSLRYPVMPQGPVNRIFTHGPQPDVVLSSYRGAPRILFGDDLALVGWRLGAQTMAAGDVVPITLYWRSLRPSQAGERYDVWVALEQRATDRSPAVLWRDANPLAYGLLPMELWKPAQTLAEEHLAYVASEDLEPGKYDLTVRVRQRSRGNVALSATTPEGKPLGQPVTLGSLEVVGERAQTAG